MTKTPLDDSSEGLSSWVIIAITMATLALLKFFFSWIKKHQPAFFTHFVKGLKERVCAPFTSAPPQDALIILPISDPDLVHFFKQHCPQNWHAGYLYLNPAVIQIMEREYMLHKEILLQLVAASSGALELYEPSLGTPYDDQAMTDVLFLELTHAKVSKVVRPGLRMREGETLVVALVEVTDL